MKKILLCLVMFVSCESAGNTQNEYDHQAVMETIEYLTNVLQNYLDDGIPIEGSIMVSALRDLLNIVDVEQVTTEQEQEVLVYAQRIIQRHDDILHAIQEEARLRSEEMREQQQRLMKVITQRYTDRYEKFFSDQKMDEMWFRMTMDRLLLMRECAPVTITDAQIFQCLATDNPDMQYIPSATRQFTLECVKNIVNEDFFDGYVFQMKYNGEYIKKISVNIDWSAHVASLVSNIRVPYNDQRCKWLLYDLASIYGQDMICNEINDILNAEHGIYKLANIDRKLHMSSYKITQTEGNTIFEVLGVDMIFWSFIKYDIMPRSALIHNFLQLHDVLLWLEQKDIEMGHVNNFAQLPQLEM